MRIPTMRENLILEGCIQSAHDLDADEYDIREWFGFVPDQWYQFQRWAIFQWTSDDHRYFVVGRLPPRARARATMIIIDEPA